jgi:hypothetical protein
MWKPSPIVQALILLCLVATLDLALIWLFVLDQINISLGISLVIVGHWFVTVLVKAVLYKMPKARAEVQVLVGRSLQSGRSYPMLAMSSMTEALDLVMACDMYHSVPRFRGTSSATMQLWVEGHPLSAYNLPNRSVVHIVDYYEIINLELV